VGGALVDSTGWQGLFWIDAAIAAGCIPLTLAAVAESRDPNRSHSIDVAGMLLIAVALVPFVLGLSEGSKWGWASAATVLCFVVTALGVVGFVAVERRVSAPLLDLKLLRNSVLVGSTLAILIVAGAINGLMYVISLYFQDPAGLRMSPLEAGLATLPAAAGIVLIAPFVSGLAGRFGSRQVIGIGFVITTAGFAVLVLLTPSWGYGLFVLPLVAVAVGMGLSNGCASAAATASVPPDEVGAAAGVSNMARYVGAALMTAAAATIYTTAAASTTVSHAEALTNGVARSALLMAIASGVGIVLAVLYGRHRPAPATATDRAAAAAVVVHTIPATAGRQVTN
jgi:MFS family permease